MATMRTGWIDGVKGVTIIMVVAHHALLGLDAVHQAGASALFWDELLAAVRMPLFFLVAGLFARKAIDGPRRKFVDSKIIHFVYFYLLWSVILFAVRFLSNGFSNEKTELIEIFRIGWDPISTIWFMYALCLAFLFVRALRKAKPALIIGAAFLIQILALALPNIPHLVILNKCLHLFFFFVLGVYCSANIREHAQRVTSVTAASFTLLFCATAIPAHFADVLMWPVIYPIAALLGIASAIAIMSNMADSVIGRLFQFVGGYSLPIYLTHFLPVAAIRIVMFKLHLRQPLLVYVSCIIGSVLFGMVAAEISKRSPLRFLFDRPKRLRLNDEAASGSISRELHA